MAELMKDQVLEDFSKYITSLEGLRDWLSRLYYSEDMGTFFNRPVLSILMTTVDFLVANLREMRIRYEVRRKE